MNKETATISSKPSEIIIQVGSSSVVIKPDEIISRVDK